MKTSRLEESGLVTPGRHHVPGYGGYCPQMRFNYGKTFGQTTAALLADNDIPSSGNPVLGSSDPEPSNKDKVEEFRSYLIHTRDDGDTKFGNHMIPGYMGFVPRKNNNYFGSSYTQVCRNSTADLELDRRKIAYRKEELEFIKAVQDGTIEVTPDDLPPHLLVTPRNTSTDTAKNANFLSPGKANCLSPEPRRKVDSIQHCDFNSQKNDKTFKAGYSGFVPRSRELFGQGYPEIWNKAMNTFQGDRRYLDSDTREGQHNSLPPTPRPLYPEESGLTPRYTGHVPGNRFRHGMTYGRSTKNTKNFQMPDVSM